jgi:hypothetical protein
VAEVKDSALPARSTRAHTLAEVFVAEEATGPVNVEIVDYTRSERMARLAIHPGDQLAVELKALGYERRGACAPVAGADKSRHGDSE